MVSQQVLNGHWDEIKGRIQETFGQLTDDDLAYAKGNVTQLIGLIERKTGMAKQQIEEQLDKLVDEGQSMLQKGAAAVQAGDCCGPCAARPRTGRASWCASR